jgi:hypothetical protein
MVLDTYHQSRYYHFEHLYRRLTVNIFGRVVLVNVRDVEILQKQTNQIIFCSKDSCNLVFFKDIVVFKF